MNEKGSRERVSYLCSQGDSPVAEAHSNIQVVGTKGVLRDVDSSQVEGVRLRVLSLRSVCGKEMLVCNGTARPWLTKSSWTCGISRRRVLEPQLATPNVR